MKKACGSALVTGIAASLAGIAVFTFSGTGEPAEVSQDVAQASTVPAGAVPQ